MKNIKYLFLFVATVFLLNSCEEGVPSTSELDYVTFENDAFDLGVDIDGTNDHEITVYTTQVVGTDRTFNIMVDMDATTADAAAYSVPATVVVPANTNMGVFTVTLNDVNIGGDGKQLVLDLDIDAGVFKGEEATIFITRNCYENKVEIKLTFDDWAEECSWELLDDADGVIASGSGYENGAEGHNEKLCLFDGNYTFKIYDVYGDGGTSVSIVNNGVEIASAGGGDYEFEHTIDLVIMK